MLKSPKCIPWVRHADVSNVFRARSLSKDSISSSKTGMGLEMNTCCDWQLPSFSSSREKSSGKFLSHNVKRSRMNEDLPIAWMCWEDDCWQVNLLKSVFTILICWLQSPISSSELSNILQDGSDFQVIFWTMVSLNEGTVVYLALMVSTLFYHNFSSMLVGHTGLVLRFPMGLLWSFGGFAFICIN